MTNNTKTCGGFRTTVTPYDESRQLTKCPECGKPINLRYTLAHTLDVYIARHVPQTTNIGKVRA